MAEIKYDESVDVTDKVCPLTFVKAKVLIIGAGGLGAPAAIKDMRANGWVPLGNWHSHPETPSRPLEEDKRLAYDSKASYLILSLMEETPVLHSFHIEGDEAQKEELVIEI